MDGFEVGGHLLFGVSASGDLDVEPECARLLPGQRPAADKPVLRIDVREPMLWIGAADGLVAALPELPLALLDPPCGFRAAAIAALDAARRPYRVAATSASLSGLITAVSAGIAVTLRTARWVGRGVAAVSSELDLPAVPDAIFSIRLRHDAGTISTDLADLLCDTLDAAASGASL